MEERATRERENHARHARHNQRVPGRDSRAATSSRCHRRTPRLPPTHQENAFRNWRRCLGDARCERSGRSGRCISAPKEVTYGQMCLTAARMREGKARPPAFSSKVQRRFPMKRWFFVTVNTFETKGEATCDLEWRCGTEGNWRVKQGNCSVRDSVGHSDCLDQHQERRRQNDRSEARNGFSVASWPGFPMWSHPASWSLDPVRILTFERLARSAWNVLVSQHRFSRVQTACFSR